MRDFEGNTPLHDASRIGLEGILEKILATSNANANANVINKKLETPMHLAATYGHARVTKLLLEQPNVDRSYEDCDGNSLIRAAARNGHEDIVKMLWRSPYYVNVNRINGMNRKIPLPFVCRRKS